MLDRAGISEGTTGLGEGNVLVSDRRPGIELELATLGRQLWVELGERFPEARVTRKGALVLDHPEGIDAGDLEPALAPGIRCLLDPDELQVDPAGLARAMLEPLSVRTGAEVLAVEKGCVTLADGQRLTCGEVVIATGPWTGALTGLPVEPRKGQLVALAAPGTLIAHKLIEAIYVDAVASAEKGRLIASVIEQSIDGDEILVGSTRERAGFEHRVDPAVSRAIIDRAARFVPALRDLPIRREWCGFRAWLPDGLPAVGTLPDGCWVTTGQEGSGVGIGPLCGLLLAQLIRGERPIYDPTAIDPRRFFERPLRPSEH